MRDFLNSELEIEILLKQEVHMDTAKITEDGSILVTFVPQKF